VRLAAGDAAASREEVSRAESLAAAILDERARDHATKRLLQHALWSDFVEDANPALVRSHARALVAVGDRLARGETGPDRTDVDARDTAARALLALAAAVGSAADLEEAARLPVDVDPALLARTNPELAASWLETRAALRLARGGADAEAIADQSSALLLRSSAAGHAGLGWALWEHGVALARAGRLDDARRRFDEALAEAPADLDLELLALAGLRVVSVAPAGPKDARLAAALVDPRRGAYARRTATRWLEGPSVAGTFAAREWTLRGGFEEPKRRRS
jgi:hypothetical protein